MNADHDRALRFALDWLSAPYDPEQHPEWLNLARAYAELSRTAEAAPDLYEALKGLLSVKTNIVSAFLMARAALAKAEPPMGSAPAPEA